MPRVRITTRTSDETKRFAASLRPLLKPGTVIALHGELGSGKTCFVSGLAESLHCREPVSSPTFTLLNEYSGDLRLFHADAYRLDDAADFLRAGLAEYFEHNGVFVIEWAERVASLLPDRTLHIRLHISGTGVERLIEIEDPAP